MGVGKRYENFFTSIGTEFIPYLVLKNAKLGIKIYITWSSLKRNNILLPLTQTMMCKELHIHLSYRLLNRNNRRSVFRIQTSKYLRSCLLKYSLGKVNFYRGHNQQNCNEMQDTPKERQLEVSKIAFMRQSHK